MLPIEVVTLDIEQHVAVVSLTTGHLKSLPANMHVRDDRQEFGPLRKPANISMNREVRDIGRDLKLLIDPQQRKDFMCHFRFRNERHTDLSQIILLDPVRGVMHLKDEFRTCGNSPSIPGWQPETALTRHITG